MAVRIRLTRVGATKRPSYRVVAIDSRRSRDGRSLEILGFYDPLTDPVTVQIDTERVNAWIAKGARPSDTVGKLIRIAAEGPRTSAAAAKTSAKPKAAKASRTRKTPAKAEAAAAVAEPAAAEPAAAEPAAEATTAATDEATPAEAPTAETAATPEAPEADEAAAAPETAKDDE